MFKIYEFYISQIFGFPQCWNYWKRRKPHNDEDPSNTILDILDMGPISTRKHEWNFGICLPEDMKLNFGNQG